MLAGFIVTSPALNAVILNLISSAAIDPEAVGAYFNTIEHCEVGVNVVQLVLCIVTLAFVIAEVKLLNVTLPVFVKVNDLVAD